MPYRCSSRSLNYMFPTFTAFDSMGLTFRNVKQFCEFPRGKRRMSNFSYLLFSKFMVGSVNTVKPTRIFTVPSFIVSIMHIIGLSSKKQMIGSDTKFDIATMANFHSSWNRTIMKFPRICVGSYLPVFCVKKLSIPRPIFSGNPYPTWTEFWSNYWSVFVNFRPKYLFNRHGIFDILIPHNEYMIPNFRLSSN